MRWLGRVKWLALMRWLILIVGMTILERFCIPHNIGLSIILGVGAGSGIDMLIRNKFHFIQVMNQNSNEHDSRK